MYHTTLILITIIILLFGLAYGNPILTLGYLNNKNIKEKFLKYFFKESGMSLYLTRVEYSNPKMKDVFTILFKIEILVYFFMSTVLATIFFGFVFTIGDSILPKETIKSYPTEMQLIYLVLVVFGITTLIAIISSISTYFMNIQKDIENIKIESEFVEIINLS